MSAADEIPLSIVVKGAGAVNDDDVLADFAVDDPFESVPKPNPELVVLATLFSEKAIPKATDFAA